MKINDLFVICGEKSGDLLAANILSPIKDKLSIRGVVGPELLKIDALEFCSIESFQLMGFVTILSHLPRLFFLFRKIRREILATQPKLVLLVDNAEFSLLMAKSLRKGGFSGKIVQLVSPSIWAWRKKRKAALEKNLDALFCIFPFEPSYFKDSPLEALYIGHPLIESLKKGPFLPKERTRKIALFPGSRPHEIHLNLPLQLEAISHLKEYEISISVSHPKLEKTIQKILNKYQITAKLIPSEDRYQLMQEAFFALSKLGTVNLELAFFEVPTIAMFALPRLERLILQHILKIFLPHYSIVNIIANRRIFPEYIGPFATKDNLRQEVNHFIQNPYLHEICVKGCKEVKEKLTSSSMNASEKILHLI